MNQQAFEARVLEVWMKTRIPLTRANLQYVTRAPRKKMERWLDEMVSEGVLEVDADDDGEMIWSVRGAVRSSSGPATVAELDKVETLRGHVAEASTALTLAARATGLATRRSPSRAGGALQANVPDQKSLIASGALSFFFGPLGWLYAAPLKEAIPAILLFMLAFKIPIIGGLLWLMLPLLGVASGLAGVAYAWRYNQNGERTSLLGGDDDAKPSLPPRRRP